MSTRFGQAIRPLSGLVTAVVLAGLLLHESAATAAACNPSRPNDGQLYIAGTYRDAGTTVGGVYSKIKVMDPFLWSSPNSSGSFAQLSESLNFYGRIGWERVWNPIIYLETSVEYQTGSTHYSYGFAGDTIGSNHYYTVLWAAGGPNKLTFQKDGTTLLGPVGVGGYSTTVAHVRGRLISLASQMPGGTAGHEFFTDTNIYYSGAWHAFDGGLQNSNGTYFVASKITTKNYEIWDRSCST